MGGEGKRPRKALAAGAVVVAILAAAVAASGASAKTQVHWIHGYESPGTPNSLNMVGVLRFGPSHAPNILILNPGTSAGAAYFAPLARAIVKRTPGWQVWSVERRENLLEDQSVFNRAKRGKATPEQVFDYYLKWVTDHTIKHHVQPVPDADVQFAKQWGMNTEIHDLRKVVRLAKEKGRHVVRRRTFARRLDHDGVRHLGLQRQAGRQGPLGPGVHRRGLGARRGFQGGCPAVPR